MTNDFNAYMPRKIERKHEISGAYRFNATKRLHWLQRLCLRILARLGCQHYQTQVRYETVTIDFANVVDLIRQQARAIREMTGRWPKCAVLGYPQADELELWTTGQIAFQLPGKYDKFDGMTIIVAPYFDGVICLEEVQDIIVPPPDTDDARLPRRMQRNDAW